LLAIEDLHKRDIIYRDLKPDNIQVGHFGEVIVCDWGLGKNIGVEDEESTFLPLNQIFPDLLS
jgi:serine/threonine-protein kinase